MPICLANDLPAARQGAAACPLRPDAWDGGYRVAEVAFAPDSAFDYPSRKLHGSFSLPPAAPARAEIPGIIEESFDSGFDSWLGDLGEWRRDAAGAHPAGLGLFQPSLALRDYEFEFLARIEQRGLAFVFRASNLSNYHRVAIRMSEPGRYELRRSAVIGGIEGPAVVVPLGTRLKTGAAFTVKVRAVRNELAILLEGEMVAQWADGRLPTGGVGFTSGRGEQARIYWIRLTPAGSPHSEAAHRLSRSTR